ncbi:MAG: hypothetical protein HN390_13650 [Anaerolineae bacterium]|jgi:hypothetical protein|nr:hypothetical protein [Anaerolineae bacterium]
MHNTNLKKTTAGIRIILYVASFLVLSVGLSLYFFSEKTDIYFSWTINPPMTAAFLGVGYLASFLTEFLSAREKIWARARIAVPGVLAFTILTSIVTLLHLDRFHFDSSVFITLAGTWVWLFIYISVPIALSVLWALQARQPGIDPARKESLPVWIRSTLILQGLIMFFFGAAMLLIPETTIPLWPWKLSVLTSQAIGGWGVGIGIIALHASWENDWARLFPMMAGYTVYGALQTINLLRYPDVLDWTRFSALFYTFFVMTLFLTGAYGTWKAQQQK